MTLEDLKLKYLQINKKQLGKIYSFIDFANVNKWYENDIQDEQNNILLQNEKMIIDLEKLANFTHLFSGCSRFYFGLDLNNNKSKHIVIKAGKNFSKAITKPVQKIKHYLGYKEINNRKINHDSKGKYIYIPKCNFDVEMSVDAMRLIDKYNTFCLFSGDADFAYLLSFLKRKKKKIILFKNHYVQYALIKQADLVINSSQIKKFIAIKKQTSRLRRDLQKSGSHPRVG